MLQDHFFQLKPGLSSYAGRPSEAAQSLEPLIRNALDIVPRAQHSETTIEVRATAGLRLLPGAQADEILAAVRVYLKTQPFRFTDGQVSIMDGIDEGAYAWLTLNYLLGRMSEPWDKMVAAVDQGGGSVQIAYALGASPPCHYGCLPGRFIFLVHSLPLRPRPRTGYQSV